MYDGFFRSCFYLYACARGGDELVRGGKWRNRRSTSTAFPLVCRYVVSSLVVSVILSSSSDPSILSNALALATGDFGEVGLRECADLDFPSKKN